jgi:EpsI family protein
LNGLPTLVAGWQGRTLPDPEWVPTFSGATQNSLVRYLGSAGQVDAALVRYVGSQQDGELANVTNSVIGSNGWQRRSTNERIVDIGESQSITVTEHLASRNGRVRRIWYWYEVDGNIVKNNLEIKLNEALSLLSGRPTISSAIMVSTIEGDDAPDVLQAFFNDTYNTISECLVSTVLQANCRLGLSDMEIN